MSGADRALRALNLARDAAGMPPVDRDLAEARRHGAMIEERDYCHECGEPWARHSDDCGPGAFGYPCREYGHGDCATFLRGPCTAERRTLAAAEEEPDRYGRTGMHGPDGWCGETRPHEHGLSEGIITYTDGGTA